METPLRAALEAATNERKRLQDVLGGIFVHEAQKKLERSVRPINDELNALTLTLQQNPPQAISYFLRECKTQKEELLAMIDEKEKQSDWDRDSALHVIDCIDAKMKEARELALADLNATEFAKQMQAIAERPLPEVEKKKKRSA